MTLLDLPATDQVTAASVESTIASADSATADELRSSSYVRCADGNGTLPTCSSRTTSSTSPAPSRPGGKCGLAPTCLDDAIDRLEPYGVWGGELVVEGVAVAIKRGRGRPPKNPRPVLVDDEVPLPPHLVA